MNSDDMKESRPVDQGRVNEIKAELLNTTSVAIQADQTKETPELTQDQYDRSVTITISREDAEELLRVAKKRENPDSWIQSGTWTYASELRLQSKLQAALENKR
jgi:hypothetical protein